MVVKYVTKPSSAPVEHAATGKVIVCPVSPKHVAIECNVGAQPLDNANAGAVADLKLVPPVMGKTRLPHPIQVSGLQRISPRWRAV